MRRLLLAGLLLLTSCLPAFAAAPAPIALSTSAGAGIDNLNNLAQYANTLNYYYAPLALGGTVTGVAITTAHGISGSVSASTTTPAITLTLGAITPTSIVDAGTMTAAGTISGGTTFTIASGCGTGGSAPTTLTGGAATGSFVTATTTCSPVITLPTAPNGWWCQAWDETTTTTTFKNTTNSATSCTLTESTSVGSGDTIVFHAEAF